MIMQRRIDDVRSWTSLVLPLLFIQGTYPRERIQVRDPGSPALTRKLLAIETRCVVCGRVIYPVRGDRSDWGLFLAVTCDQTVRPKCSRNGKANSECRRLIRLIRGFRDQRQPGLWDSGDSDDVEVTR